MACRITLCSAHAILPADEQTKKIYQTLSSNLLGCLLNLCVPACNAQNQLISGYLTPTLCRIFYEKEEIPDSERTCSEPSSSEGLDCSQVAYSMSQSILKRQNHGNFEFIVPERERHRCPTGQIGDLVSNSVKTDSQPGSCEGFDPKSCLTNEQFHVGAEKPWHFCAHRSLSNAPQPPHLPDWQASVRF